MSTSNAVRHPSVVASMNEDVLFSISKDHNSSAGLNGGSGGLPGNGSDTRSLSNVLTYSEPVYEARGSVGHQTESYAAAHAA